MPKINRVITMIKIFYIIHVLSIASLFGTCIGACVLPTPENRRKMLMFSGIASLGAFVSGFGMQGMLHMGFPLWLLVKICCWLFLSAIVGVFFRSPEKRVVLMQISTAVVVIALTMVYLKPF